MAVVVAPRPRDAAVRVLLLLLIARPIGIHAEPVSNPGGRTLRVGPQYPLARIADAADR